MEPSLGDCLFGKKEQSNGLYKNVIAVIRVNSCDKGEVTYHASQNISKVASLYLSLPHCYLKLGTSYLARVRFHGSEKATQ